MTVRQIKTKVCILGARLCKRGLEYFMKQNLYLHLEMEHIH